MIRPDIKNGTVIQEDIGGGCTIFHQVIKRADKTILIGELKNKIVERNVKMQTVKIEPMIDAFVNDERIRLRLGDDGRIGPLARMHWWSVWKGKGVTHWMPLPTPPKQSSEGEEG